MIDLSIVVPTWNTRELVLDCLASLDSEVRARSGSEGIRSEVVIVDNGSEDGTAEAVARRHPWVQVIALPENLGYSAAINAGLRVTRGRFALLLNSDTRVVQGALEYCVRYLDAHPDVGVVGPQLINPDRSKQNSVHNFPRIVTELVPKGVFQFLFRRRFPSRRWSGEEPIDVEAVAGAALFLRVELLSEVGYLPEDYFFFLEETDWCLRVGLSGWRVVHLPRAHVIHVSGASSKRKNAALTRIEFHRSLYRFYRKHQGLPAAILVLGLRFAKSLFYVLTQAPFALVSGRARRRWKVHRDVLVWFLRGCPRSVGVARVRTPDLDLPASHFDVGNEREDMRQAPVRTTPAS